MMRVATCWQLLPPGVDGRFEGPEEEPVLRWVECFATLDELADRITRLAWGAAPTEEGGRGSGAAAPQGQAEVELSYEERRKLVEENRIGSEEAALLLRRDDLRRLFPVKLGAPFRRWSPSNEVEQCLRVRGPGEAEPYPWFQSAELLGRVLELTDGPPDLDRLHLTIARRCGGRKPASGEIGQNGGKNQPSDPIYVRGRELEAVIRAMLTRPLVLLAGVSGSGKTQIARRLGKAWVNGWFEGAFDQEGKHKDNAVTIVFKKLSSARNPVSGRESKQPYFLSTKDGGEFSGSELDRDAWYRIGDWLDDSAASPDLYGVVAVQSDWTDASHLWGYHVPLPVESEGFYGTRALGVFLEANRRSMGNPAPAFVLLDEMNLSRPEHYGSDLLSAMELIGEPDGDVIELHRAGRDVRLRGAASQGRDVWVPQRTRWPSRLLVMGTVNVDETTFSFAPKVLDRASLLEFVEVKLDVVFKGRAHLKWLKELNDILEPYNLHIAYRAANEILESIDLATDECDAKDEVICNKVLPRIRGPRASVEKLLFELRGVACELHGDAKVDPKDQVKMAEHIRGLRGELAQDKQPQSITNKKTSAAVRKIDQMLRRASTVGFTSFFG